MLTLSILSMTRKGVCIRIGRSIKANLINIEYDKKGSMYKDRQE